MPTKRNAVTGATGLLGSHIAEQLIARGERVRALVRPTSDARFLHERGVEVVQGDLLDFESVRKFVTGADVVYHCAAKVGDWGTWKEYQDCIIEATRNLLNASANAVVGRVLYVSSIAVYGHLPERASGRYTEEEPLGQHLGAWDFYSRAKIQAEEFARKFGPDMTIVRPSWMYGPRDRITLPRVLQALRAGRVRIVGTGDNRLNVIYAGDVARGAILAASSPAARGQTYNLSSEGELTQREFIDALTDSLGLPRVTETVSFSRAYWMGYFSEFIGHLIRMKRPPYISRYAIALVGRSTQFSIDKAPNRSAGSQK